MDKTRITNANKQHARRSAGAGEIKEINMSILIKGIPLAGYEISIMRDGDKWRARVDGIWCEVEEIKAPHGRLIDIKSVEEGKFVKVSNGFQRWWNDALESVIDNASTVIEAED